MKKLMLGLLAAMVMSVSVQAPALAHEYNPFRDVYKVAAHREAVPGKVQFVYVIVDEKEAPIPGAVLQYVDHDGVVEAVAADDQGKVRLVYTKGLPFVQLKAVEVGGKALPAIGKDITADADREDIREGDVEYYVLQKDAAKGVVYVFDAD